MNRLLVSISLVVLLITISDVCVADRATAARGHEFGFAVGWGVRDGHPELETCTAATHCDPKPGIAGTGKGQFSVPVGVAVNEASGNFYVLDEANGRVERFGAKGEYLGEFDGSGVFEVEGKEEIGGTPPTGPLRSPKTIAVDNSCAQQKLSEPTCKEADPSAGDVYVTSCGPAGTCEPERTLHDVIDKFTSNGEFLGQVQIPAIGSRLDLMGVAVSKGGDLWVAEEQNLGHSGFDEFNNAAMNEQIRFVADEGVRLTRVDPGLAVNVNGDFYAIQTFESPFGEVVAAFTPHGEYLGVVSQVRSRGVTTEWKSGDVYVDAVHAIERFTSGIPASKLEEFGGGQLVDGRGVAAASTVVAGTPEREGPVYVADPGSADVVVFPLEEPKPPTIEGVSVSSVTSESATLRATVNPRGARTEYQFEYGACSSPASCVSTPFQVSVPNSGKGLVGVPLDFEGHEVSTRPQDLKASTTYHLRVSARNEKNQPGEFAESTEVVFRTEPVSVEPLLDGRRWEMVSPPHKHGTLILQIGEQGVIQAAASGDALTYVTATPTEDEPHGFSNFVQVLARRTRIDWISEDLALSHSQATGQSIGAGLEYRFFSQDLSTSLVQPFGAFEPATSPEATEQTPYSRTDFIGGNFEAPCTVACYRPLVTASNVREGAAFGQEGACPGAHRVICGPVVMGATPDGRHVIVSSTLGLTEIAGDNGGLYEWSNGKLSLVSILPSGMPASPNNAPVLGENGVTRGAISKDGSQVVWSESHSNGLYLRNLSSGKTIEVNEGIAGTAIFEAATADGSRIFFTDSGGLYVYEAEKGQAVRLTTPVEVGEPINILGDIAGISDDGTYVYFVANGRISKVAQPLEHSPCDGSGGEGQRCDLYVEHFMNGAWQPPRVVAMISGADSPDFSGFLSKLTARVSPDGRWLVFMSQLPATGYDNRDAVSGAPDEEVFLYDSENSTLVCVSCNPTEERPVGTEASKLTSSLVATGQAWPSTDWLAANVPGWPPYRLNTSFYQPRYLLDDGRVFFDTSDALVPRDVNGTEDVYEYEPSGVGSCTTSSRSYVEASRGCVALVSAGTSRQESAFLDASETGSDVFFLTGSKLVASDFDSALDVYDARECTSSSPCLSEPSPPPQVCVTEASCKQAPTPQPEGFNPPASAAFTGLGNLVSTIPLATTPRKAPRSKQALSIALTVCRHKHQHSRRQRAACLRHPNHPA